MTSKYSNLMFRFLAKVERKAAYLRGKGYGTATVEREVEVALWLLGRKPQLVLDVGGNKGAYTAAVRQRAPEAEIHIFEPSAACCAELRARFADDPSMIVNQVALSDQEGQVTLFSDKAGSGLASLAPRDLGHLGIELSKTESVSTIRLEDYWNGQLGGKAIDLAKLDVEGHELRVLRGFGKALESTKLIQFEFGGTNIDSKEYFKDYFQFFTNRNYRLFRISPVGLEQLDHYDEADEYFSTTNFLASKL
jgi:FkbM family methyltransferase